MVTKLISKLLVETTVMMMNLLKLNLLRNLLRLKAKTNLRKSLRLVVLVLEWE